LLAILTTHPIQYQVPLWQALAKDGKIPFEVWYLTRHGVEPSPDAEFRKSFQWDIDLLKGYPYQFLETNQNPKVHRFWGVRFAEDLKKKLQQKKVKALWIQGWQVFAYWQAVWQAHEAGVEVWLRGESNDLAPTPLWKRLPKGIFLGALFKKIDRFLYIGEANRRLYERYGVSREQLYSAPYGVDNERFARQAKELLPQRTEIRRRWKIPEEAFCILFAGKFIPKKRPFDLVESVCNGHLRRPSRPIHLLFAGSGELGRKLRQTCCVVFDAEKMSEGGEGPTASFVGFLNQTEISKAYVAADCLVLPSDHRETWGLVINEALASGIPCAASDACGCAEDLIYTLHPKLRFRMGNQEALTEAISLLMEESPSLYAPYEQVTKFSIETVVQTVRELCQSWER